jgi:hypothetical protein
VHPENKNHSDANCGNDNFTVLQPECHGEYTECRFVTVTLAPLLQRKRLVTANIFHCASQFLSVLLLRHTRDP